MIRRQQRHFDCGDRPGVGKKQAGIRQGIIRKRNSAGAGADDRFAAARIHADAALQAEGLRKRVGIENADIIAARNQRRQRVRGERPAGGGGISQQPAIKNRLRRDAPGAQVNLQRQRFRGIVIEAQGKIRRPQGNLQEVAGEGMGGHGEWRAGLRVLRVQPDSQVLDQASLAGLIIGEVQQPNSPARLADEITQTAGPIGGNRAGDIAFSVVLIDPGVFMGRRFAGRLGTIVEQRRFAAMTERADEVGKAGLPKLVGDHNAPDRHRRRSNRNHVGYARPGRRPSRNRRWQVNAPQQPTAVRVRLAKGLLTEYPHKHVFGS